MVKSMDEAIALFRSGKSPRECDKLTGINYKKIEREAKKRGVEKGDLSHLSQSMARDKAEFVALGVSEQDILTKEIQKQLDEAEKKRKYQEFLESATHKNLTHMMSKVIPHKDKNGIVIDPNASVSEHVQAQTALNRGSELLVYKAPELVINNTNAQQINAVAIKQVSIDHHEAIKQYQDLIR